MTRKDYELIARVLNEAHEFTDDTMHRLAVERITNGLAASLWTTNPRFDKARFITASGGCETLREHGSI